MCDSNSPSSPLCVLATPSPPLIVSTSVPVSVRKSFMERPWTIPEEWEMIDLSFLIFSNVFKNNFCHGEHPTLLFIWPHYSKEITKFPCHSCATQHASTRRTIMTITPGSRDDLHAQNSDACTLENLGVSSEFLAHFFIRNFQNILTHFSHRVHQLPN